MGLLLTGSRTGIGAYRRVPIFNFGYLLWEKYLSISTNWASEIKNPGKVSGYLHRSCSQARLNLKGECAIDPVRLAT